MPKAKVNDEECAAQLRRCHGLVSLAAQQLPITKGALYARIARSAELRQIKDEAIATQLDIAEGKLFKALSEGQPWAVKFFLEHHGGDRGYHRNKGGDVVVNSDKTVVAADVKVGDIVNELARRPGFLDACRQSAKGGDSGDVRDVRVQA